MKSGDLRHIIVFELRTTTTDSFGAEVETWTETFRVPGRFTYKSGREFAMADDLQLQVRRSEAIGDVLIRYKSGITRESHRILFDGQTWNITAILPDIKNTQQIIEVSQVV